MLERERKQRRCSTATAAAKERRVPTCAHHVSKFRHAHAVGLDALVGQDVVDQHQLTVVQPDLLAASLLGRGAVALRCQPETRERFSFYLFTSSLLAESRPAGDAGSGSTRDAYLLNGG